MKASVIFLEKQKVLSDIIRFIPKENIRIDEPMSKHTSFKTGGNAEFYILVDNENQIKSLLDYSKQNNIDLYIIGNGSNLLVSDKGIKGIVAKISFEGFFGYPRCLAFMCEFIIAFLFEFFDKEIKEI